MRYIKNYSEFINEKFTLDSLKELVGFKKTTTETPSTTTSDGSTTTRRDFVVKTEGEDVRTFQTAMDKLGFNMPQFGIDGKYGKETCTRFMALMAYLKQNHTELADGVPLDVVNDTATIQQQDLVIKLSSNAELKKDIFKNFPDASSDSDLNSKAYTKNFDTWFSKFANKWEGGIANRPKDEDSGGYTNKGLTLMYFTKGNWGRYIGKPSTKEVLDKISDAEVKAIAYNVFWLPNKIDKITDSRMQILAMETIWGSGSLRGLLNAKNYKQINALLEKGVTFQQFYDAREAWLRKQPNAGANPGWFPRLADLLKLKDGRDLEDNNDDKTMTA